MVQTICEPFENPQRSLSSAPPLVQSPQLHDSPVSQMLFLLQMTEAGQELAHLRPTVNADQYSAVGTLKASVLKVP